MSNNRSRVKFCGFNIACFQSTETIKLFFLFNVVICGSEFSCRRMRANNQLQGEGLYAG